MICRFIKWIIAISCDEHSTSDGLCKLLYETALSCTGLTLKTLNDNGNIFMPSQTRALCKSLDFSSFSILHINPKRAGQSEYAHNLLMGCQSVCEQTPQWLGRLHSICTRCIAKHCTRAIAAHLHFIARHRPCHHPTVARDFQENFPPARESGPDVQHCRKRYGYQLCAWHYAWLQAFLHCSSLHSTYYGSMTLYIFMYSRCRHSSDAFEFPERGAATHAPSVPKSATSAARTYHVPLTTRGKALRH
jgi:hypothetical protein